VNGRKRWPDRVAALVFGVLSIALWPTSAEAHFINSGLGPIYDGISHVFLSPEDFLPAVAIAVLAGLNGPIVGRRTLFALTAAWLVAGGAGLFAARPVLPGVAVTASLLVLGALTAADRRLSPVVVASLAVLVGLLHGWLNGAGLVGEKRDLMALLGIVTAIFVIVALVAAAVVSMRSPWARLAFRVAGSWVAAIGLLMLGWQLRTI
jgi:urease accessory protein